MKKEALLKVNYLIDYEKVNINYLLIIGSYKNNSFHIIDEFRYQEDNEDDSIITKINNDLIIKNHLIKSFIIIVNNNCYWHYLEIFPKMSLDEVDSSLKEKLKQLILIDPTKIVIKKRAIFQENKKVKWSIELYQQTFYSFIEHLVTRINKIIGHKVKKVIPEIEYYQKLIEHNNIIKEDDFTLLTINDYCYSLYKIKDQLITESIVNKYQTSTYQQALDEVVLSLYQYVNKKEMLYLDIQNGFYEKTYAYLLSKLSDYKIILLNERIIYNSSLLLVNK